MAVPSGYQRSMLDGSNPISANTSTGAMLVDVATNVGAAGMALLSASTVTANNSGNTANASATVLTGNASGKMALIWSNAAAYLGNASIGNDGSNATLLAANTPLTVPIANVGTLYAFAVTGLAKVSALVLG